MILTVSIRFFDFRYSKSRETLKLFGNSKEKSSLKLALQQNDASSISLLGPQICPIKSNLGEKNIVFVSSKFSYNPYVNESACILKQWYEGRVNWHILDGIISLQKFTI